MCLLCALRLVSIFFTAALIAEHYPAWEACVTQFKCGSETSGSLPCELISKLVCQRKASFMQGNQGEWIVDWGVHAKSALHISSKKHESGSCLFQVQSLFIYLFCPIEGLAKVQTCTSCPDVIISYSWNQLWCINSAGRLAQRELVSEYRARLLVCQGLWYNLSKFFEDMW